MLRKALTLNPREPQQDYSFTPLYNPTTGQSKTNTTGKTDDPAALCSESSVVSSIEFSLTELI